MSWKASAWAKATRGHRGAGSKLVLMILADYHDEERDEAWPSQQRLADDCEMSLRAIQYGLANLEEAGFITPLQKGNQYQPTRYRLNIAPAQVYEPAMSEPAISASAQVNPQSTTSEPAIPVGTSLHEPPRREEREKKLPKKRITEVDQEFREVMQARFGPTLSEIDERIDEALAHKAASKYTDQQAYVRGWLRREIERKANSQNGSNPNAVTRRGFTPYQGSAGQTVYHPKPDADGVVRLGR